MAEFHPSLMELLLSDVPDGLPICDTSADSFPGIAVRHADCVVAAAGFTFEPDQTMSMTVPLIRPGMGDDHCRHAMRLLFDRLHAAAAESESRYLHCLVPVSLGSASVDVLNQVAGPLLRCGGMTPIAGIVGMTKESASVPEKQSTSTESVVADSHGTGRPRLTFKWLAVDDVINGQGQCKESEARGICELVARVLQNSDDLPVCIRPSAAQLIAVLRKRQAELLLVASSDHAGAYVGVAAVAESVGQQETLVEYLGVCPGARRSGIARFLLSTIEDRARQRAKAFKSSSDAPNRRFARVTAYVDSANDPASQLYSSCGYAETAAYQLWYRPAVSPHLR